MKHGRSRSLRAAIGLAAAVAGLFGGNMTAKADLGLNREAYGVWDREGGHSVSTYPYTRGQEYQAEWTEVNSARSNFNWTAMDALLQFAYDQNQRFFVKIQPVSATTVPPWIFSAGVPEIVCPGLTYGYPLDPEYKLYLSEMVVALGKHLRQDVPAHLRDIVSLVRVDTGATGDEGPYDPADESSVPAEYFFEKDSPEWQAFRIWLFGVYDQAFQHGTGPAIPLIFQDIETPQFQIEQDWVKANVTSGFGAKYGGQVRGHHLSESRNVPDAFKALSMDTPFKFFSANEMDQTWEKPYFQLNLPIGFYWCAAESLNAGLTIQDWSGSALEGAAANNFEFAATLFNTWAAELDPPTARGGFCIFHEGLASDDTNKFSIATYGNANINNTARYTAICAAYSSQGAKMDDLTAATWGQVAQRDQQDGFNDAGWLIWPGNYERFITQINPDNTSKGLWRVRGTLTASSHPYDRFARRFDAASGKNTMYFDVNDNLTPAPGQSIKLSVVYLDAGTGQFGLLYDAVGNSQKSAFTVTKANSNTWKTNTVTVTDWVFGNNGPNGADLMLTSVDSNDDTFSRIELVKLVNVTMNVVGSGTVSARNDFTVYSPVSGTYATGQRLDMTVTPASGWSFSGWSGGLSGSNSRAIFFPTNVNTTVTATFVNSGATSATDNFESGNWVGGTGWTGGWSLSGVTVVDVDGTLSAHLTTLGQITRIAATPIVTGGQLAFNWHIKSLEAGESAQAEIYDGSWHVVWTKASLVEESGTTNINLSAYSNISQVRFTVNAPGGADNFWVDNVTLSGFSSAPPVNNAPVFTADPINKAGATEDVAYSGTISGSATDADGDTLTYSAQSGPSWLSIATSGALSGTPSNADVGSTPWTVQVSDGKGGTDAAVLNIAVANVNDAPVFTADPMSKANATEDAAYTGQTLAGSATDVDVGATLTYSKISGPAWLSVAANGALSGTPANSDVGTIPATVQVSDGLGGTDTAVLNITVVNVNDAPVFTVDPMSKVDATAGTAYTGQTLAGSATDVDAGATLTYSKVSGPAWLVVATSGALSGTPAGGDAGANSWTVQVSDGLGGTDTAVLNISVIVPANNPPAFTADPMSKANATEDAAYTGQTLAGSATDPDAGATLSYSKVSGPAWLSVAADGTLSGTPANSDVGTIPATVQVSDGLGGTDTAVLNITVINVNDAPVFTADPMSKANATEDAAYTGQTLAGSATDVDAGASLSYSKVSGPSWLSVAADGTLSGTPANSDVGTVPATVQVSDGAATDTAVLNITVINVNDAPVFTVDPMSRANVTADTAYTGQTLAGSATDVDVGATLTYSKVSGPAWLSVAANGTLSGTPATTDVGANVFTVQVSDGTANDTAVLNITVDAAASGSVLATDDFESGTWTGGSGWGIGWSTSGGTLVEADSDLGSLVAHLTENGQITRTATTPVAAGGRLAFNWKIKSLDDASEYAQAEVYDGSWHIVWTDTSIDLKLGAQDIDLNAYGAVSQVRFSVVASGSADHFYVNDVSLSGSASNTEPVFTADPMSRTNATVGTAYSQTLASSATDADNDPLTYSKVSGPAWLSVALDGTLSGTPASTNVGANSWTVQVSDGNGGTDTAVLNITVNVATTPPTFVAAGAIAGGTGTIKPALPAGLATGDILLLFVETANQACSISAANGGTWAEITPAQGTGTAAATTATRLTAFWSRYNGTQGVPTVSDSGDHTIGRMIAIRGAAASGNPWDVTAGGVEATSDTSGSIPGATTTVANTLVVTAVAASLPDATSTAIFSGWANANLTSLTERTDNANSSGNGGALGVATGIKATAGAYGNTTVTHSSAAVKGMMSIAIKN